MKIVRATLAALMLLALMSVTALADGGGGYVEISVDCFSNPETVTVANNLATLPISVVEISSLDDPRGDEPFFVGEEVAAGEELTFESGSAADENVLTTEFIFDNDAEGEGVAVQIGPEPILQTVEVGCDEGSERILVGAEGPGMPDTGAGAAAGGGLPLGGAAAALSLLGAAGYAVLTRR